jgi:hypothetical protein
MLCFVCFCGKFSKNVLQIYHSPRSPFFCFDFLCSFSGIIHDVGVCGRDSFILSYLFAIFKTAFLSLFLSFLDPRFRIMSEGSCNYSLEIQDPNNFTTFLMTFDRINFSNCILIRSHPPGKCRSTLCFVVNPVSANF